MDKPNMEYSGVWILAEQVGGKLQRISYELITRGRTLADKRKTDLVALVFAGSISDAELASLLECGCDRAVLVQSESLEHFLVEPFARCMLWVIQNHRPEIILAGATSTGRTLMPYVAAPANAGLTADCTELDIEEASGNLLQTRPAIGGNIMATIKTPNHRPQMATVRPHSTRPAAAIAGERADMKKIQRVSPPADLLGSRVRRIDFVANADEHVLANAEIVVTAGRGIKKAANMPLVRKLASSLGAAVGATRDVVDRGWMSYPHQVGLSGKTINPRLYVGVGVSGSIQHLAGMQTSQNIVAINNDPEAQIFKVSDIGIVGDLNEVVPELTKQIEQLKK